VVAIVAVIMSWRIVPVSFVRSVLLLQLLIILLLVWRFSSLLIGLCGRQKCFHSFLIRYCTTIAPIIVSTNGTMGRSSATVVVVVVVVTPSASFPLLVTNATAAAIVARSVVAAVRAAHGDRPILR